MAIDPKLVVALEARLDKFEKQLKQAGVIADRQVSEIEDRFARANPQFGATFAGNLLGNLASQALLKGASLVGDLIGRFKDLESAAKFANIAMNDLFGLQEAGRKLGAPVEDVTKSVRGLAVLLDQMQRGEDNSLSKLFDANPDALKGVNRDALTLQQTFQIVADLVQNARTEVQKIDIAQAAGQAATLVPLLEKGGTAVRGLQKAAADSAPDLQHLANLAKDFDQAWSYAIQQFKAYIVEGVTGPVRQSLLDMIDLALKFLGAFKGGVLEGQAERAASAWLKVRDAIASAGKSANAAETQREDRRSGNVAGGGTASRDTSRGLSNVPKSGDDKSEEVTAFDRAANSISRHTAALQADAAAVGLSEGAHAQLRAEMQLLDAARRDDNDITDAKIAKYAELRKTMEPLLALQAAGIMLTAEQAQKFVELPAAMGQTANMAAVLRDNFNKLQSASQEFGSALSSSLAGAIFQGQKLDEVLRNLAQRLGTRALDNLFNLFFGAPAGGGASPFLKLLGFGGARAGGGAVQSGQAYIVGEKRPELFVPNQSGRIIPNVPRSFGGGGAIAISNNFALSGDVSPATIDRLERMTMANARAIAQTNQSISSASRYQRTGVM